MSEIESVEICKGNAWSETGEFEIYPDGGIRVRVDNGRQYGQFSSYEHKDSLLTDAEIDSLLALLNHIKIERNKYENL